MTIPAQSRQYVLSKFDGFHNLTIREAPVPKPKPAEVLVKVHAVSLNYRDLTIATGTYPFATKDNGLVPTSDLAAEVIAVGDDVQKWHVGDRVCANFNIGHLAGDVTPEARKTGLGGSLDGGLTEYATFPEQSLVKIPDHLTWEEASTLPCAAVTAWNAFHGPTPLKAGDWVLVQGTGGVSIFALQIAVASGANVIATSSSDEKLRLVKKLGAKYTINYKTTPDWDKEVQKLTGGSGVDHVIEVGGPETILKSIASIRFAGWIHVIGFLGGQDGDTSPLAMKALQKAAFIRGVLVGSVQQFQEMNRLFEAREIHPVVDKVFDFEQAQEAYKYLESQKHVGKVVIKVSKA